MKVFCCIILLIVTMLLQCACSYEETECSSIDTPSVSPAELAWPYEWLPDGFPVAEYAEIYKIEQTDQTIEIILFAEEGPIFTFPTVTLFMDTLLAQGYIYCHAYDLDDGFFVNRDGYMVRVDSSDNFESPLSKLNEHSPTGFTYSIAVEKSNEDIDFLFCDYPTKDTDLGLEYHAFEEWPIEYLTDDIPAPLPDAPLAFSNIVQRKNGLFVNVTGPIGEIEQYLMSILQNGFYEIQCVRKDENGSNTVQKVYVNRHGTYFYVETVGTPTPYDSERTYRFQYCGRVKLV